MEFAGQHLDGDHTAAFAVLDDQVGDEPLFIGAHAGLHDLLVHDVEDRLAGDVGDEERPGVARASEGPRSEAPLFVPVEDDAHVLQVDDLLRRHFAHQFDRVLVAEVVASFNGVVDVGLDGVVAGSEGRVDAPLGCVGVASDGVDLAHHGHVGPGAIRRDRGPHTREPRSHN